MNNKLLRVITALFLVALSVLGFAQADDPPNSANSQVSGERRLVREYQEGEVKFVSKDYKYEFTRPAVGHAGTKQRLGRKDEYGWVHYRGTGEFKYESLAGMMLIVDKETDLPVQKAACKNLIWQGPGVKVNTRTFVYEKTLVREYETPGKPIEVPGPIQYRDRDVPGPIEYRDRYLAIMILAPQQQYIANLGSPTVISPVLNGIPGFSINNGRTNLNAFGVGLGGNGYGAAAAAAAAAAATGVGVTGPGGTGIGGTGTSGTSGAASGGDPAKSGSGK